MNKALLIDAERPFDVRELFFSTTDRKGIITSCNDVFVRVAGYSPGELLGAAHNIVRHPHMPRCVFRLLWDYLLAGKDIGAYVKNRAQTGEHYWVFAMVTPIDDGFLSVRLKPTSALFGKVPALYAELLEVEASHGADWRQGMQAATERLLEYLAAAGFASYDELMTTALKEEVRSRQRQVSAAEGGPGAPGEPILRRGRLVPDSREVFARVAALDELKATLPAKKAFLDTAVHQLAQVAVNAAIGAARTGTAGRSLAVVAEEISRVSGQIRQEIPAFSDNYQSLCSALDQATFSAAQTVLQDEMARLFRSEETSDHLSEVEQIRRHGKPIRELVDLLDTRSEELAAASADHFERLRETLGLFADAVDVLSKVVRSLRFAHATGQVEAHCFRGGSSFAALLHDLRGLTDELYLNLGELRRTTAHAGELLHRGAASMALVGQLV